MSSKLLEVQWLVRNASDRFPAQGSTFAIGSNILDCSSSYIWHHLEYCMNSGKGTIVGELVGNKAID